MRFEVFRVIARSPFAASTATRQGSSVFPIKARESGTWRAPRIGMTVSEARMAGTVLQPR